MNVRITAEDIQFYERDFREHHNRTRQNRQKSEVQVQNRDTENLRCKYSSVGRLALRHTTSLCRAPVISQWARWTP